MGLVWWEPCLWGFAALVGSDGPRLVGAMSWGFAALVGRAGHRLVGAVSMGICSFGRQFWASFGCSRVYGDLQLWSALGLWWEQCGAVSMLLWSAVLGLVWWEPYGDLQALVGSDGPRLVRAMSMGICSLGRQ